MQAYNKRVGVVGLGRMGRGVAERLARAGYEVYGYDSLPLKDMPTGVSLVSDYRELVTVVDRLLLLVPAGECVDEVLVSLVKARAAVGVETPLYVADCGNSFYADTIRRHTALADSYIYLIDAGISGGVHGAHEGYCVMIGGPEACVSPLHPALEAIAAAHGCAHLGPIGAGHYVKMVHNAIEYGLMQAYGEGFQLLKQGHYPEIDSAAVARLWQHGSVIRSRLLELCGPILADPKGIAATSGVVHENGTGRWAVHEAHKSKVPFRLIETALAIRSWSRESGGNYATKLVALLRNAFGGHAVEHEEKQHENN